MDFQYIDLVFNKSGEIIYSKFPSNITQLSNNYKVRVGFTQFDYSPKTVFLVIKSSYTLPSRILVVDSGEKIDANGVMVGNVYSYQLSQFDTKIYQDELLFTLNVVDPSETVFNTSFSLPMIKSAAENVQTKLDTDDSTIQSMAQTINSNIDNLVKSVDLLEEIVVPGSGGVISNLDNRITENRDDLDVLKAAHDTLETSYSSWQPFANNIINGHSSTLSDLLNKNLPTINSRLNDNDARVDSISSFVSELSGKVTTNFINIGVNKQDLSGVKTKITLHDAKFTNITGKIDDINSTLDGVVTEVSDAFSLAQEAKRLVDSAVAFNYIKETPNGSIYQAGADADLPMNAAAFNQSTANGNSSFSIGYRSQASGFGSFAGGGYEYFDYDDETTYRMDGATANGDSSFAFGIYAQTNAESTISMGTHCKANAMESIAMGINSVTTHARSAAIGDGVKSTAMRSFSCGAYNLIPKEPNTKALFTVGNGISDAKRSNAFAVTVDDNNDSKAWIGNHYIDRLKAGFIQNIQLYRVTVQNTVFTKDYLEPTIDLNLKYGMALICVRNWVARGGLEQDQIVALWSNITNYYCLSELTSADGDTRPILTLSPSTGSVRIDFPNGDGGIVSIIPLVYG